MKILKFILKLIIVLVLIITVHYITLKTLKIENVTNEGILINSFGINYEYRLE